MEWGSVMNKWGGGGVLGGGGGWLMNLGEIGNIRNIGDLVR